MTRTVLKWLLGISVVVLVLLIGFTIGFWVLFNIVGAILLSLMGNTEIHGIPFSEFMANFVGSPLFYVYIADFTVLAGSLIALAVTHKDTNHV